MDYAPIRDYAAVGDCHGSALVSRTGSVDWCSLERFDADPIFCRLLDSDQGGFLEVVPSEIRAVAREYEAGTNVLNTTIFAEDGAFTLIDFMPVGRQPRVGAHNYVDLDAPHVFARIIIQVEGRPTVTIRYRPSAAFGRVPTHLTLTTGAVTSADGPVLYHDLNGVKGSGDKIVARIRLAPGERRNLMVAARPLNQTRPLTALDQLLSITRAFWREWLDYNRYDGRYKHAVDRSLLTLKLLTYAPTGAIVAAATSSLPEEIGGTRNWDYRYCWLRDSAFTLAALATAGYGGEAARFSGFLQRACAASYPTLNIMYGIDVETDLTESIIDHLDGYQGSRPVRKGNGAHDQRQMDVFGEVMDWALVFQRLGGTVNAKQKTMLRGIADYVVAVWDQPDQGLWEMRGEPRHHVHGKIMCWVALDRAARLLGDQPTWARARDAALAEIKQRGVDTDRDHLIQAYDHTGVDAALLTVPLLGFPVSARCLEQTVQAVERELRSGDFVYRYIGSDGLEGGEGCFLICSFWLVEALLAVGRIDEGRTLFERLIDQANDVGLYAEEIDPNSGAFLGNMPQAFTHLSLVSAAFHLAMAEEAGARALAGSHADRTGRSVGATFGIRGLLSAFSTTRRVGRLLPSRKSVMPRALAQ
ncbi:glycoside hydrolase family 15 protein [Fodinicurvata sp. EGI_FJ10296]|uniref:glycoside hydrolase family 15 protein n=1 Tax=Fodinicurvata sp. EGI_FJ10296 TaxID=3231908 RepID=UPI0034573724